MAAVSLPVLAQEQEGEAVAQQTQDEITPKEEQENTVDVKEIVFGHIGDSYEWHITTWGNTHILYRYLLLFIVALRLAHVPFFPSRREWRYV